MVRKNQHMFVQLVDMPWWCSVCMAVLAYGFLRFAVPEIEFESAGLNAIPKAIGAKAHLFALLFLIPLPFSILKNWGKKQEGSQRLPDIGSQGGAGTCPQCGNDLVLRTAKKGPSAGNKFYGCSSYPKCRFVENA